MRSRQGVDQGAEAMPTEKNHSSDRGESNSIPASADAPGGDTNKPRTRVPSEVSTPSGHKPISKRRLLMAVLATVVLAIGVVFGVPWIREMLTTVSTDDAYVNGHVTFVAARVPGQVSRVLVDDNNRVQQGRSSRRTRPGAISGHRCCQESGCRYGKGGPRWRL